MATSIVDTLFGVSPERLQQQRAAAADARALEFAKLDPFQQANFAIGRGASGLAGAIGGALGGQDPELQRVTRRQQVAGQLDFTSEDSIRQGMAMLSDDPAAVQQLAQILRQQQESGALVAQRQAAAAKAAEPKAPPTTPQITNANAVALRAGQPGTSEYEAAFNASLDQQMIKPPGVVVNTGDERNALALKELDIPRAKEFSDAAGSARKLAQDSQTISRLLQGAGGGKLVKLTTDIQRTFGFETDNVTADDLVNALATRGAVQIRAPGSGATSDLEFKSYLQAFPSLSNSEAGRQLMSKYATAFAKRSAKLADHARKLIREDKYSEEEIARFDESLGPVLDDEFYNFSPGRRPNVPVYTPPAAPAAAAPVRSPDDLVNQYLSPRN